MQAVRTYTEILGFSQTYQCYTGEPFVFPITDPTFTPQKVFLSQYKAIPNCQTRFGFDGDLSRWKDVNFIGYEGHVVHNIIKDRQEISRLIFDVSGEERNAGAWQADIEYVVEILHNKYDHVQELYLQPVIGGIDETLNVRAVKNQPHILEAINLVINQSPLKILKLGAIIRFENDGFNDLIGHLTIISAQQAKRLIFDFYYIFT